MAPLPLGRIIAQVVVPLITTLARALPAAYAQALQNARRNGGQAAAKEATQMLRRHMSKDEALMVLNISEQEATAEAIQKQYDRYFAANAIEKGGSFYLQSKVYRAKEMLDEYIKEKKMEQQEQEQKSSK